jgi:hypothetical protein
MKDLVHQRAACVTDNDAILLLLFVRVFPPDKLSTARIKHKMWQMRVQQYEKV